MSAQRLRLAANLACTCKLDQLAQLHAAMPASHDSFGYPFQHESLNSENG
jgi:hypothetical protein